MREDMHKVVTERRRTGGHHGRRKDWEDACKVRPSQRRQLENGVEEDFSPKRESIRARHVFRYGNKELSDFLAPLRRYLLKQVGRPWDDVWSDICKVLKGNGLQANHIKDHVRNYVGGIPHSGQKWFRPEDWFSPTSYRSDEVYVDENKIVRVGPVHHRKRDYKEREAARKREAEANCEYYSVVSCIEKGDTFQEYISPRFSSEEEAYKRMVMKLDTGKFGTVYRESKDKTNFYGKRAKVAIYHRGADGKVRKVK